MTDHLTPADFAAVPWGGRAIPPEGSVYAGAVRVPEVLSDPYPWTVGLKGRNEDSLSDSMMAATGWTLPAPADPWDALPDALQAAWDTGEERVGEDEEYICRRPNGTFALGWVVGRYLARPEVRFRPRPRPSWQDAEVVEASTESVPERRLFLRCGGKYRDRTGDMAWASDLIDPVPMTVQKKEER